MLNLRHLFWLMTAGTMVFTSWMVGGQAAQITVVIQAMICFSALLFLEGFSIGRALLFLLPALLICAVTPILEDSKYHHIQSWSPIAVWSLYGLVLIHIRTPLTFGLWILQSAPFAWMAYYHTARGYVPLLNSLGLFFLALISLPLMNALARAIGAAVNPKREIESETIEIKLRGGGHWLVHTKDVVLVPLALPGLICFFRLFLLVAGP